MKTKTTPNSSERFFERSLRMTALLTLIVSIGFALYQGVWPALAILSGSVWSIVNLLFVRMALVAILRPQGPDKLTLAGILLIKFPALYLAGYFLLSFPRFVRTAMTHLKKRPTAFGIAEGRKERRDEALNS